MTQDPNPNAEPNEDQMSTEPEQIWLEEINTPPDVAKQDLSPKHKLWFAGGCLLLFTLIYMISSGIFVFDIKTEDIIVDSAKEVWTHFSHLFSNVVMLIIGYYFAKE